MAEEAALSDERGTPPWTRSTTTVWPSVGKSAMIAHNKNLIGSGAPAIFWAVLYLRLHTHLHAEALKYVLLLSITYIYPDVHFVVMSDAFKGRSTFTFFITVSP